jgi:hypothetical protein
MFDRRPPMEHDCHARQNGRSALARSDGAPAALGDVVRDAMDHARVIVRDSVAIGKIEARQVADRVARDLVPRAAFGLAAAAFGALGVIFALIALFIGLGAIIPSVAWRLFLFAVMVLGLAAIGGLLASRSPRDRRPRVGPPADDPSQREGHHVVPIHPVSGIGE